MSSGLYKVESGTQLLSRLCKKPDLEQFYPALFNIPPKYGEIIELSTDDGQTFLLNDILSELLLNGGYTEVIIFSSDGNFCRNNLVQFVEYKIVSREPTSFKDTNMKSLLEKIFKKLHLLEVYDSTQLYSSIYNIEKIIQDNPNISVIVFDSLTAFYWSEQGYKIMRMNTYVKNLLNMILSVTKDYKVIILFTKPEYFNSLKDIHDGQASPIHYQIQTKCLDEAYNYKIIMKLHDKPISRKFSANKNHVLWQ